SGVVRWNQDAGIPVHRVPVRSAASVGNPDSTAPVQQRIQGRCHAPSGLRADYSSALTLMHERFTVGDDDEAAGSEISPHKRL
ncbi:MAG: hypothetical protein Q8P12_07250, partial [bacterium]|nr:hypothetical protein [bacterium]